MCTFTAGILHIPDRCDYLDEFAAFNNPGGCQLFSVVLPEEHTLQHLSLHAPWTLQCHTWQLLGTLLQWLWVLLPGSFTLWLTHWLKRCASRFSGHIYSLITLFRLPGCSQRWRPGWSPFPGCGNCCSPWCGRCFHPVGWLSSGCREQPASSWPS